MKKTTIATIAAATTLALPAAAGAHVSVNPGELTAGSFSKVDLRVPNESDDKGTIRVSMRLPDGVFSLRYQRVPGWKVKVFRKQLDEPVDAGGGFQADEQFTRVVWTARKARRDRIAPGQFQDFQLSLRVPSGAAGTQLAFPTIQSYQGGERVKWTGAADGERPAPRVTLLAPEPESH